MKRYWLFAYESYYPAGGMRDFVAAGDSVDELKALVTRGELWGGAPGNQQALLVPRAEPYITSSGREWYRNVENAHIVDTSDARTLCSIYCGFEWV